ncbi:RagB/SusD family nutrient uptake outer membrane protein [Pedobacter africanus]|uniref:Starch-binding associating with outer membrane n=1 Tax=Pedobacter africanus TaxID=151894 RepID=A0A1W1YPA6_9SPHI|nr:RagB/SusD family nutrient uptake outer membrane protein [Pedobacter africanus]SMC37966.1 Starch-binding associating with outer membrane [Pedobacter africanus]
MKVKNIKYMLLLLSAMAFAGCTDELLDRQPTDKLTNEAFWTSKKDADLALAGCYSTLRTPAFSIDVSSFSSMQFESLTDNAYSNSTLDSYTDISRGILTSATGGIQSRMWTDAYRGIARCNWFLGNLDKVPGLEPSEKARMTGEAYFLRAFFYNELTMLYGDVPLVTEELGFGPEVFKVKKSPKAEVVAKIIKDLDAAAAGLPNTAYGNGHAVRGSALALKARICLYNEMWPEAAAAAKLVIDEKKFSIASSYEGIFFGAQNNNPEIIFSIKALSPNATHNLDLLYGSRFSMVPLHSLADAYEMRDGTKPVAPIVPSSYNINDRMRNDFYQNRDPRLKLTIFTPGAQWAYNTTIGFNNVDKGKAESPSVNNLGLRKYININVNDGNAGATGSEQAMVKLRYADVLLMYAEAVTEMGGGTTTDAIALKALNDVRARPGITMPAKTVLTRELVRNERRVELAFEGLRYYDIKRWNIAKTVMNGFKDPGNVTRVFEDKHYLWPIPQSEVDKMGPDFQNAAYR